MNFGFLVQKWPFCDAYLLSKKKGLKPLFYSVLGVSVFLGQGVKKEILKNHPKRKHLTDNWKVIFWYFCCFLFFFLFFFNIFFCYFFVFVFFVLCVGSGEVARRATSLGPKPSLFVFVVFVVLFFVFFGNLVFPQKRHFLFIFSVSLSPLAFFDLPLFLFLFLCLSLFFFFSFFLLVFFAFFWFLVFVSFFLSLFCFFFTWKEQHQNIKLQVLSSSIFSLFLVSCLILLQVPFSYLCYFLILSYVFCSTSRFLISKQTT